MVLLILKCNLKCTEKKEKHKQHSQKKKKKEFYAN